MKKLTICILLVLTIAIAVIGTSCFAKDSTALAVTSKSALLMSEMGDIVFEHNGTDKRPIASMTKLMTLICAYDAIKDGKISLDDDVEISQRAASMGGSQVFLDANTTHKVKQLLKSIIVCSANDSCVAIAEHIDGSVENFVARMNKRAETLKLRATHFENCTGLPQVNQYSCAIDVGKMMIELIKNPHYFECANVWMEDYIHPDGRVTGMTNTNKLVKFYNGCDGGKTGYTSEAKHCLSATAKKGNTRLIAVVIGAEDSKTRFAEVSNLLNFGFANYETKTYLDVNDRLTVDVNFAKTKVLDVAPQSRLAYFGKKGQADCELKYQYDDLKDPINVGDVVGHAQLVDNGNIVAETNLLSCTKVDTMGYLDYFKEIVVR